MSSLEGNEKIKEGKRLTILTPNKLLTRFPILLGQRKARNKYYKLRNEISQICIFCINTTKSLKKFTTN